MFKSKRLLFAVDKVSSMTLPYAAVFEADTLNLALLAMVIFSGAMLQSFTGFGFALIVAPIAALIAPWLLPGPVIALTLLVTLSYTVQTRHLIDWHDFGFIMLGRLPLSIAAGLWIASVDPAWISLIFGLFLLASVLVTWRSVQLRPTPLVLTIAGGLSGFFGTLTSVGAPPLAIAYQNRRGPELRATLGANIILGSLVSLFALAVGRQLEWPSLVIQTGAALPFLLLGSAVGSRLVRFISPEAFRQLVLVTCATSAALLTWNAFTVVAVR